MAAFRKPLMFPARRPDSPPMLMILPHPLRCMCGAAALAHRIYPTTFVLMSSSNSSSSADASGPVTTPPGVDALFTRISTRPSWATVASMRSRTDFVLVVSQTIGTMRRRVAAASVLAASSSTRRSRAQIATSTPSPASSWAIALPMPLLPPVTIATFPVSPRSMCNPPSRRSEPQALELELVPRIDREHLRRRLPERGDVLLRRALQHRERAVVHRDDELRLEPLPRGVGRVLRVHDEVAADRHQDEVGLVVVGDQLHVAEEPRVAHVVDLEPVLQLDDEAGRFAARVRRRLLRRRIHHGQLGRVLGAHLRDRDLRPEGLHLAALAEAYGLLAREPPEVDQGLDEPGRPEHLGAGALGEVHEVAPAVVAARRPDVIAMAVGDEDHVDLAELGEVLLVGGCLRIPGHERVDHDHLAARRGHLERRLAEPVHLDLPGLGLELRARQRKRKGDDERAAQLDDIPTMQPHVLSLLLPTGSARGARDPRQYNRIADHRIAGGVLP